MASIAESLGVALEHHRAGNLAQAEQIYRQVLRAEPANAEAWHLLGVLAHQVGQHQLAISYIRQALEVGPRQPSYFCHLGLVYQALGQRSDAAASYRLALELQADYVEAHSNLGLILMEQGKLAEAAASFQEALRLRPDFAEAHSNLGNALVGQGKLVEATASYQNALRLKPDIAEAHNNLGIALAAQGRPAEAVASYQQALRNKPDYAEAHNNLGVALKEQNKLAEAVAAYRQALRLKPDYVEAYVNLGRALMDQGKLEEAVDCYQQVLRLRPGHVEAHNNLGNALKFLGRLEQAVANYREVLRLKPDYAEAHNNLGVFLKEQGNPEEALACFQRALYFKPDFTAAYNNIAAIQVELGQIEQALDSYQRALRLRPDFAEAHEGVAYALRDWGDMPHAEEHLREALRLKPSDRCRVALARLLPPLYRSLDDLESRRRRLIDSLANLLSAGCRVDLTDQSVHPLFYLGYQGYNERDVQRDLARLYMAPLEPARGAAAGRRTGRKIKVGFLSACFFDHTVARLFGGMIAFLTREVFEVVVLSIGQHRDGIAEAIRRHADRYLEMPANLPAARQMVASQQLDVLVYTDIGMDPVTYSLGFSRLAPVQCVMYGHPLTTGIPTIDYFISSELFEADDADQHYTETLVRMKTLGMYYHRPAPAPLEGRDHFGLRATDHVYGCPQTLFKLHPAFDEVLAGILRRDPQGVLVLIRGLTPPWMEFLSRRWAARMPDVVERIRWLPKQDSHKFLSLQAAADVLLDPFPFGGGKTSLDGLALGMPVVTWPTPFLRGRVTLGLYRKMGVMDCVAATPQEYIDIAVRLGTDPDYRATIVSKIRAANGVLFEDVGAVRELEQFLHTVARC